MDRLLKTKTIIRVFIVLIIITFCMKLCDVTYISDTLVLGLMAYVAGLIALHNTDKKNNGG